MGLMKSAKRQDKEIGVQPETEERRTLEFASHLRKSKWHPEPSDKASDLKDQCEVVWKPKNRSDWMEKKAAQRTEPAKEVILEDLKIDRAKESEVKSK